MNQAPLFCRRAGIILTLPDMDYTGEHPWDHLTADVYTGGMPGSASRELYEDDGHSDAYLKGAYRSTDLTLDETGNAATLRIDASKGEFQNAPSDREWVVRYHLWPGQTVHQVTLDGKALQPTQYQVLQPADEVKMPLMGEGQQPPQKAGAVVELQIPKSGDRRSHSVSMRL